MTVYSITTDSINDPVLGFGFQKSDATNSTLTIGADAFVFGDTTGIQLSGAGAWTVTVNSGVYGASSAGYGIELSQISTTLLSTINISATGDVFGGGGGIRSSHATNITNNAIVAGENGSAIVIDAANPTKSFAINNTKTGIIGSGMGWGVEIFGNSVLSTVTRSITNAGLIIGDDGAINTEANGLTAYTGNDKVTNSGTLGDEDVPGLGDVRLGLGDDTFTNSGFVWGDVHVGDGKNTVSNTKDIDGDITGGTGNDTITNSGTIFGDVTAGTGVNTITNSKTIDGSIFLDVGGDTVKNTGTVFSIEENTGIIAGTANIISSTGKVLNGIHLSGAADTVTIGGTIGGDVILGDGSNKIVSAAGTIGGSIIGGKDADDITTGATLGADSPFDNGYVYLGEGANIFKNSGKILGFLDDGAIETYDDHGVIGGTGLDKFTNSGTILYNVDLARGTGNNSADEFTNSGIIGALETATTDEVASNVYLGKGDNKVTNTGTVVGTIFLGGGKDTMTGGANSDHVQGGEGAESINLGSDKYNALATDGSPGDIYYAGGIVTAANEGIDTIDGGLGLGDVYLAGTVDKTTGDDVPVDDSVYINLDSLSGGHTDNVLTGLSTNRTIAASTAYGLDVSGDAAISPTKTDNIKGFEWAVGGTGNDVIFGNAAANQLYGDSHDGGPGGNDSLYGYDGNDTLIGGAGDDILYGGKGKDLLIGDGSDGSDIFVYRALTDSTLLAAGRDLIAGFDGGGDVIDLSQLADAGNPTFLGMNTKWTKSGSEMRGVWTATGTQVQIDKNADGKVDFAVDIADRLDLTAANFFFSGITFGDNAANTPTLTALANSYYGAGGDDTINGGAGNDTLMGGSGNDTINGDAGDDTLSGGADNDILNGGSDNDLLIGGSGDDTIDGGGNGAAGDTAVYGSALANYLVTDFGGGQIEIDGSSEGEGIDTVSNVEHLKFGSDTYKLLVGTGSDDTPPLTSGRDFVLAGAGDDTVNDIGGNDYLDGGSGSETSGDTLSYQLDSAGVTINLATGVASGTGIGNDIIVNFENATGGSGADTIMGDGGDNALIGGGGADTISGDDGADTITGGDGSDTIDVGLYDDQDSDTVVYSVSSEFGDTVTGFVSDGADNDVVTFVDALNIIYDDVTLDDTFKFFTTDGTNGGSQAVALATYEAIYLSGTNGEGLAGISITSGTALAAELNGEFIFNATGNPDALIVVNALDSDQFSVWQFVDNGSSEVQSGELSLVGLFTTSTLDNVTTNQFILA